jgi:ribose transport system ATP-binding protein
MACRLRRQHQGGDVRGRLFVAGDRLHESLIPGMMVRENLFMNPCKHGHAPLSRYNEKAKRR